MNYHHSGPPHAPMCDHELLQCYTKYSTLCIVYFANRITQPERKLPKPSYNQDLADVTAEHLLGGSPFIKSILFWGLSVVMLEFQIQSHTTKLKISISENSCSTTIDNPQTAKLMDSLLRKSAPSSKNPITGWPYYQHQPRSSCITTVQELRLRINLWYWKGPNSS